MDSSDYRKIARESLKGNWGVAVGTAFVAALLGSNNNFNPSSYINSYTKYNNDPELLKRMLPVLIPVVMIIIVMGIVYLIIGGAIQVGYCQFNLNLIDNEPAEISDLFSKFKIFGKTLGMNLLINIYVFLLFLLFIIPGIIAIYSYSMAPYILAEHPDMKVNEVLKLSKKIMKGNKFNLFILEFSFIGWVLLCIPTCNIGFLWLNPYMSAARAAFYRDASAYEFPPSEIYSSMSNSNYMANQNIPL